METIEIIGSFIGFLIYAALMYQQNRIMQEQNDIMREQGGTSVSRIPKWRLKSYWPMLLMAVLTIATWSAVGVFFYLRKPIVIERIVENPNSENKREGQIKAMVQFQDPILPSPNGHSISLFMRGAATHANVVISIL